MYELKYLYIKRKKYSTDGLLDMMVDYNINYQRAVIRGLVLRKNRTQEERQKDVILRECQLQLINGRYDKL